MLEPSWRGDIVVVASLPLSAVAALDEEPARSVVEEAGSEDTAVRSAWRGVLCAQGARLLGCMLLRVIVNSLLRRARWFFHYVGLDPGFGLGYVKRGAG
jgi:hypothetical protein